MLACSARSSPSNGASRRIRGASKTEETINGLIARSGICPLIVSPRENQQNIQSDKYPANQNCAKHVKIYGETQNDPIDEMEDAQDAVHEDAHPRLPYRPATGHVSSYDYNYYYY